MAASGLALGLRGCGAAGRTQRMTTARRSATCSGGARAEPAALVLPPRRTIGSERPRAAVHFLGGAFVGAVPRLAYEVLIEELRSAGILVIVTPYSLTFDHLACAESMRSQFSAALRGFCEDSKLAQDALPIFGVGHSNGALLHLLINSGIPDYAVRGNVLVSFNNRPVSEAVPGGIPDGVGDVLASARQLFFAGGGGGSPLEFVQETIASFTELGSELRPGIQQIDSILLELASGVAEFRPTPAESRELIRSSYSVKRNLLIRFSDDSIDQTDEISSILASKQDGSMSVETRTLDGTHATPCASYLPLEALSGSIGDPAVRETVSQVAPPILLPATLRASRWITGWIVEQSSRARMGGSREETERER